MMDQIKAAAYLKRLEIGTIGKADVSALEKLVRAHLEQIPFENIDTFDFKEVPDLDESILFEKIVTGKRGGVCFELNMLFLELLEYLGYEAYAVAARILWNKTSMPPLSHMGIVARSEGECWYCDVGYGGPGPKGLMRLKEGEQEIAGERFRFCRTEDGDFRMERVYHGEWKSLLQFTDHPFRKLDFQILNYYCARNPIIMFTQKRIINLCTPDGSRALTDMEFTAREGGSVRKCTYQNLEELEEGLKKEFGIIVALKGRAGTGDKYDSEI